MVFDSFSYVYYIGCLKTPRNQSSSIKLLFSTTFAATNFFLFDYCIYRTKAKQNSRVLTHV